jgi:membrane-bound metal-dependent hydrolase YbcI (DUF457 family)
MFIGHPAVGMASKRVAPAASLGVLVLAPMLLDFLWPVFLLLGIEHVRVAPGNTKFVPLDFYDYPWSHSLLMAIVWIVLFGAGYWMVTRHRRAAVVAGLLVVSHWFCDLLMHRPDLPLYPGGPKFGLGLWNSVPGTIIVESLILIAGVAIYARMTQARDRLGSAGLWAFVALLALAHIGNIMSGPPPDDQRVIAWASFALLIIPILAFWIDRHRTVAA